MRLVHDADVINLSDVPGDLRRLADEIEAGAFGDARHALLLIDTSDSLFMESLGTSFSRYETAGLLTLSLQTVFND